MIEQSSRIAILTDHTKLGSQAMCMLCPVSKIDHVITGRHANTRALVRRMRRNGVNVTDVAFD
jgi:DeoR/GlpR family transcriptional regulator of sugar metabolism